MPATTALRSLATLHLDETVARATVIYTRYIRTVQIPGVGRVLLIAAQVCPADGAGTSAAVQTSLLAEVSSRRGLATIQLGTPSRISSGNSFRSATVLLRSGHGLRLVSMVPDGVTSVICRHAGSDAAGRRYVVVDHLVVVRRPLGGVTCDLMYRNPPSGVPSDA